jgi:ribonucleotide reductase, class II
MSKNPFPPSAPAANPIFYRTYSRMTDDGRETFEQVTERTITDIAKLGRFTEEETELVRKMQEQCKVLPSGRWLWTGGTEWIQQQKNFSGAYNCTSTRVTDFRSLALMMDLAMMGSGTGAVLEGSYISRLPQIRNRIKLKEVTDIGATSPENRREHTYVETRGNTVTIDCGDSRVGWVEAYEAFLDLSASNEFDHTRSVCVYVDLSRVRRAGERLKGLAEPATRSSCPICSPKWRTF